MPITERRKELKRRRHRRKKLAQFARKLARDATVSERAAIADKLRHMTPGGQVIVEAWELERR